MRVQKARRRFPRDEGLTIDRSNNPGALRKPGSLAFQQFPSQAAGVAAQEALLHRYIGRGRDTVASIVETYAPRSRRGGDNTDAQVNNYIAYVARRLGMKPGEKVGPDKVRALATAMREFETGRRR